MPDMDQTTKIEHHFEKCGTLAAGTRVVITIGGVSIYDATVPAGKKAVSRVAVDAQIEPA